MGNDVSCMCRARAGRRTCECHTSLLNDTNYDRNIDGNRDHQCYNEEYRKILRENWPFLQETLCLDVQFLGTLYSKNILTSDQHERLGSEGCFTTRRENVDRLLNILRCRGSNCLAVLFDLFQKTGQEHITERLCKPPSQLVANTLLSLGESGSPEEASEWFRRALEMYYQLYDDKDEKIGDVLYSIARKHEQKNNHEEALFLMSQAVDFYGRRVDQEVTANILYIQGVIYFNLGKYDDSLLCNQQALNLYMNLDHHKQSETTANTLTNIAANYNELKNYTEAIKHCSQAVKMYEEVCENMPKESRTKAMQHKNTAENNLEKYVRTRQRSLGAQNRKRKSTSSYDDVIRQDLLKNSTAAC